MPCLVCDKCFDCVERIMPSFVFDKCCGCVELRKGCLIIGYVDLVGEIILFVSGLVGLSGGAALATGSEGDDVRVETAITLVFVLFLAFPFTAVLLVGLHQNKRGHVKAYLIYSYVLLAIFVIGFFATLGGQVNYIMMRLMSLLFHIYFTLMIRSYYYKMDDKNLPLVTSQSGETGPYESRHTDTFAVNDPESIPQKQINF